MFQTILSLLSEATLATLGMVLVSGAVTLLGGLPLGTLLYATRRHHLLSNPPVWYFLTILVDITRSIPFVILMVAVTPLTRLLTGTSIGTVAAMVPLSLCAIPFFARVTENALLEVHSGLIEAAEAMGANGWQIIHKVLLPEAAPALINGVTLVLINLTGYSAMAGAIGGGGLGDVAIRYGYQRFDMPVLMVTIAIMIVMVQGIQWIGDWLARKWSSVKK